MHQNISELRVYRETNFPKRVIIVTGPVASGKTTVAKNSARNMSQPFYFDKDLLTDCTYPIFDFAKVKQDRHSVFFAENIRDVEYVSTNKIALEGLKYNDTVIINAPYTEEIRSTGGKRFDAFCEFAGKIHEAGAELFVVYCFVTPDVMKKRIEDRNSPRDAYIKNIPNYCETHALPAPDLPEDTVIDRMFVFDSLDSEASFKMLSDVLGLADKFPFDPKIDEEPKENKETK